MAKTKTIYVADDGTEFEFEADCNAYDTSLNMASDVNAYIAEQGLGKGPAGLLRKHLPGYTSWVAAHAGQPLAEG